MSSLDFPADFVLDLHDLAAIILDCHARIEERFADAQLVETLADSNNLQTFDPRTLPPEWSAATEQSQKRLAYILRREDSKSGRVTLDNLAHPDGVKLQPGVELTRRALENAFWRCKTFDSGYVLAYAAQSVFESLPPTARLRARTSSGYELMCSPTDFSVMEAQVLPHQACYMVVYKQLPSRGASLVEWGRHLSGFLKPMPWIYLFVGEPVSTDPEHDTRVALDLALMQLGGRGGANEHFALERGIDYHEKVLPRFAQEAGDWVASGNIALSQSNIRKQGDDLAQMVIAV
ncbi:uncharacterized protein B0H18DRAFT_1113331 [Fomitopsis serialis]|uniref:uncharacterized protein n=1 Tax=Fomitopsis serialis TaxID=139415 RepID=UPI002008AE23|nr:uncharacterized protein B0H18DRAFT_1113331 [Neoantrodia serialis]KAH9937506.1 hypothetical protein B0H18DRAFT_1113331 [Neoantrodia serialis]